MNDLLKEIICDLYAYIKEGELIKNGTRYTVDTIIALLEPELWGYYKELYGENSLTNNHFCIDTEEKRKKAADVKPKKVPLDDSAFFAEIAQLWIMTQMLDRYERQNINGDFFCIGDILCKLLEHRLNRNVPYGERTIKLVFDELETLKGDTAVFYREHTRLLCFFQFYQDDINRFFTLLNNLIVNKAYRDSFVRNVGNEKEIDAAKFLPVELNAEDARDMLKLFVRCNDRPISLSDQKAYNDPSKHYIYKVEAVAWLFNDYFGFDQHKHTDIFKTLDTRSKADTYKQYFKDAFESLEDKITEFPALTLLLERASRYLTFNELQYYFPCIHNNEISHDADIYLSLKVAKIENGAQYSRFEASYLNDLPNSCFKYDVEDSRPSSNKRMKLLQTMFLGSLWGLLCTQSYIKSNENSEQQKWKELLDILFRSFSPNNSAAEYAAGVLNRLIALCCIKTEMLFDTVDFTALNKSSYFTSNEALLHLYYTVTHFLTNKKYSLLEQLDFTAEMQHRILPLFPKDEKKEKRDKRRKSDSEEIKKEKRLADNLDFLKRLDCGFSFPFLWQPVVSFGQTWSNEFSLVRPDFTFRLWFDSVYEDYNTSTQKKYTDEQKYRNLNKSCIENHFFYSADRNMETHFSLHHAVEAVLEKPKRILYALYDIKQYLERIKPQQPEDSLAVPFLQKKLEHIFSNICLVLFPESSDKSWDDVFDSDGIILEDVAITFDLLEDFGKEFYTTVKEFLKIMFTGQSDWMEELDFELLIYLIYITLHLAKRDAGQTDDTPLIFNCTEDEQKRWQKTADFVQAWRSNRHSGSQLTGLLPHSYSVFHYQLSDNIQSRNIKQWQSLPQSAIIHLYNGNFEKLPQYLRNMHGIIDDAKRLFELKSIETNHSIIRESYKKLITERWNNFARKKLRKTWLDSRSLGSNDSSYGFSFHNNGIRAESHKKLIEIDTFKQKVFYVWCYHVKCQMALAFSDDGLRIEVFLGVKSKNNLTPIYSVTADCYSLEHSWMSNEPLKIIFEKMQDYMIPESVPFRTACCSSRNSEEYDCIKKLRERKSTADDMLKILCRNIVQECSREFFINTVSLPRTGSPESETLEGIRNKLNDCFSMLRQKEENWGKPNWYCMEVSKKPYDLENYPKDQILVSSGSTTDYPEIQFGIALSDDDMQMEVYFDFYRTGEEALFTLPVSEYQRFCGFAYAAHNYVKEKTLTYQSTEQEVAELKDFHTEVFKYCIKKISEQKKENFARMSNSTIYLDSPSVP